MNKSKKYSWPTTPLKPSTKSLKPSKKEKKLKSLLKKLDKAAANNEGLSKEIQDLKSDIIDLTNLE
jgi:hypothetical protein